MDSELKAPQEHKPGTEKRTETRGEEQQRNGQEAAPSEPECEEEVEARPGGQAQQQEEQLAAITEDQMTDARV